MTQTVLAYLDPGSSSMIIQMLLGGAAAVGVALKLYWRRFKRFLHIGGKQDAPEATPATAAVKASANAGAGASGNGAGGSSVERAPVETTPKS